MKTTVEISDPLLRAARDLAARQGVTLRAVLERGLRRVLGEPTATFKLRDASFGGEGLQDGSRDAHWSKTRDEIYEGRGG